MRKTYTIDKMRFDERRYVVVDFINRLDDFNEFVKEFEMSNTDRYHSPILRFEKPVDGWGFQRYTDVVKSVLYCFVSDTVVIRHYETEDEDEEHKRLARENAGESEALGDA